MSLIESWESHTRCHAVRAEGGPNHAYDLNLGNGVEARHYCTSRHVESHRQQGLRMVLVESVCTGFRSLPRHLRKVLCSKSRIDTACTCPYRNPHNVGKASLYRGIIHGILSALFSFIWPLGTKKAPHLESRIQCSSRGQRVSPLFSCEVVGGGSAEQTRNYRQPGIKGASQDS